MVLVSGRVLVCSMYYAIIHSKSNMYIGEMGVDKMGVNRINADQQSLTNNHGLPHPSSCSTCNLGMGRLLYVHVVRACDCSQTSYTAGCL